MADNTQINPGTGGDIISTDDIGGGIKVQRNKMQFGVDGVATDVSATDPLPVGAASLPLPTGASTSTKQDSGNASVASIDSKTPALGQALAAGSVPVVLTAAQLAALAPNATVSVSNFPATQPVSAVSLPLPAGAATSAGQTTMDSHLTDGTQQAKLTDGTNIANVLKSDGTAAGQNSQLVAPAIQVLTFTTSTPGAQTLLANTNISNYTWIEVITTSVGVGLAWSAQFAPNSGGTYGAVNNWANSTGSNPVGNALGTANNVTHWSPVHGAFFQLAVSALTSGTLSGYVILHTAPMPAYVLNAVAQNGTWNVGANSATGSAVPANAFYLAGGAASGNLTGLRTGDIGDGVNAGLLLASQQFAYNGVGGTTGADRIRNNEDVTLLASAARTTTQTSADLVNYNGKSALIVVLDMTSVGTGSVTISIDRKDSASGKYVNMLTGAAVTTNSTNVYRVGPDIAAVANAIAQDYLGRTFRIVVTANNANSATYSVGYSLVRG